MKAVHITGGPFDVEYARDKPKAIKQYIVTYEQCDAGIKKVTATRTFYSTKGSHDNNDYQDTVSTEILPLTPRT